MAPAAGLLFKLGIVPGFLLKGVFMPVCVFDFYQLHIAEFFVGPCECQTPRCWDLLGTMTVIRILS